MPKMASSLVSARMTMTPWIGHSPRLVTRFFPEWSTSFKIPERDYSFERFGTATRKYVRSQWFNLKSHSHDFALSLPVPKESMKTKYLAGPLLTLPLLLSSCSQPEAPEVDTASDESTSSSEAPTAKMGDLTEGVHGQVGFQHGIDRSEERRVGKEWSDRRRPRREQIIV